MTRSPGSRSTTRRVPSSDSADRPSVRSPAVLLFGSVAGDHDDPAARPVRQRPSPSPKAVTPRGVPRPVGPSYPVLAAHRSDGAQEPPPEVTSLSAPACAYGKEDGCEPGATGPARA